MEEEPEDDGFTKESRRWVRQLFLGAMSVAVGIWFFGVLASFGVGEAVSAPFMFLCAVALLIVDWFSRRETRE